MTHEEYEGLFADLIKDPDNAADKAKAILAEIDKDAASAKEASDKAAADYTALNAKLTETEKKYNEEKAKRFLGERGTDKKEPTLTEQVDDIIKSIVNPKKEGEK